MPQDAGDYVLQQGAEGQRVGCGAQTAKGRRCRHWAVRGSDPPRCTGHTRKVRHHSPGAGERRCTARTLAGERCKRWALRVKKEEGRGQQAAALCWSHSPLGAQETVRHGYYRRAPYFSERQRAAIARIARTEQPLSAELLLMRLKLRGVFAYLGREDLQPEERLRATLLLLQGARTVARLLRAQQGLQKSGWTVESGGGTGYLLAQVLEQEPTAAQETRVED